MWELFWSFEFIYFVQWEWLMPFCLGHLPGQQKRLCIIPSISFLPRLLAAGQTSLNKESTFSLFYPGLFQQQTDGHLNTKEHIQHCSSASFRRSFLINYFFLLNQLDLKTSGWILNSCTTIYNCFLLPVTYSTRVLFVSSCY